MNTGLCLIWGVIATYLLWIGEYETLICLNSVVIVGILVRIHDRQRKQ